LLIEIRNHQLSLEKITYQKLKHGLRVRLNGTAFAQHTQGPGFDQQCARTHTYTKKERKRSQAKARARDVAQ
jgi:hypothetical protein